MDPRLLPIQSNHLLQLPREIFDHVLRSLDDDSVFTATRVCYRFSFFLRPYIAAYHYAQALKARSDIAWIKFKELEGFLQIHKQLPWAQYYLGAMRLHGQGQLIDMPTGLGLLCESLKGGDFNAARELGSWLLINLSPENLPWADIIISTLQLAHQRGDRCASFVLGQLLAEPTLAASYNLPLARACFHDCLAAGNIKALSALGEMTEDLEERIQIYESLENQYFYPSTQANTNMRAELLFLRAEVFKQLGDEEAYFNSMNMACVLDHPEALLEMGKIAEEGMNEEGENDAYEDALKFYKEGMYLNNNICAERYINLLLRPEDGVVEHNVIEMRMLKIFNKRNISHIAYVMSAYLFHTYHLNDLTQSAFYSLWFQLGVQYGDKQLLRSMEYLWKTTNVKNRPIFFGCALGMIHLLGTPELNRNTLVARHYFEAVSDQNPKALQEYLDKGIRTGLLDQVVVNALKKAPITGPIIETLLNPKSPKKRRLAL